MTTGDGIIAHGRSGVLRSMVCVTCRGTAVASAGGAEEPKPQKKSTGARVLFHKPLHQYTNKQFYGRLLLGGNAKGFPILHGGG